MTRPFAPEAAARTAPQPAPSEAKRLVILGATGSIGRSCAQVIGQSAGRFAVAAVAAGRDGAAPDLAALAKLTFEPVDLARFPAMALATAAFAEGGGAPTALNGANEVAVAAFLDGRIGFGTIPRLVERTLTTMRAAGEIAAPATVAEALAIHHIARDRTAALLA